MMMTNSFMFLAFASLVSLAAAGIVLVVSAAIEDYLKYKKLKKAENIEYPPKSKETGGTKKWQTISERQDWKKSFTATYPTDPSL